MEKIFIDYGQRINTAILGVIKDILKDLSKYNEINGLSISPKKEFNICKIWLRNHNTNYKHFLKEYPKRSLNPLSRLPELQKKNSLKKILLFGR